MKNNYFEISDFIDVKKINKKIKKQKEDFWLEGLNGKALTTFKYALETKAYPKFLKENNLDPAEIRTITDFKRIPIMTKSNYLYLYPFEDILVTPVEKIKSFFMSSGSTGEPGIWPRLPQSDKSYSIFVNFLYELYWKISTKKTLYISALDLGIWASGNLQFHAALYCSENHNFTFANTGADFKYIYEVIRKLYKYYDQIIIAAYPSFARRLLDFLSNTDLDITKIDFKFMLGGESHTIEWRYYLLRKLGRAEDDISRIIDYYGTSDSGGPGLSTPLTAMIQNLCFKDTFLCMKLFNQSTVPSLFQQNPFLYVESVNNKIIVTYSGQLPLCRYDSGDNGNILKFTQVVQILKESGYKLDALISKHQIEDSIFEWPFIYLTGRSDYSVSIGGALVYPKDIEGLFFQEFANNINSFKLSIVEDVDHHQNFAVYLELKDKNNFGIQNLNEFKEVVKNKIVERLLSVNADFAAAYKMDKITCDPKIYICEYNTGLFFTEKRKLKSNFIHNLIQPQ